VVFERPGSFLFFVDWQPDNAPNTKFAAKINKIKQTIFFMVFVPIQLSPAIPQTIPSIVMIDNLREDH